MLRQRPRSRRQLHLAYATAAKAVEDCPDKTVSSPFGRLFLLCAFVMAILAEAHRFVDFSVTLGSILDLEEEVSNLMVNRNLSPRIVEHAADKQQIVTSNQTVVFYNIFAPSNATESQMEGAYDVLEEQIGQVAANRSFPIQLNYINIGHSMDQKRILNICQQYRHLTCQQQKYAKQGFEVVTLTELYQHCQKNQGDTVIYMHNKGSFHDKLGGGFSFVKQDVWRRMGTMAAASDLCLQPLMMEEIEKKCDFCGLIATPIPWLHVPGNFWSARCQYINKLLPPIEYQQAMTRYRHEFAEPMMANKTMTMKFEVRGKQCFGDGRWAAENWIGSHPDVVPCDVANVSDIQYWQREDRSATNDFNFSMAPRQNLHYMMDKSAPRVPPFLLNFNRRRIRDFHFLGGMITRWQRLYHQLPHNSSWIWSYYPDATLWREGVAKYGNQVFQNVVKENVGPKFLKTQ